MSTILVVDDMAVFREPIATALRHLGHNTLEAGNGQEALALIHEFIGAGTHPDPEAAADG